MMTKELKDYKFDTSLYTKMDMSVRLITKKYIDELEQKIVEKEEELKEYDVIYQSRCKEKLELSNHNDELQAQLEKETYNRKFYQKFVRQIQEIFKDKPVIRNNDDGSVCINSVVNHVQDLIAQLAERDKADTTEPCPVCNGSGGIEDVEAVCCGNVSDDYQCCNAPVPQQVQHRCQDCNGSGKITPSGIDKDKEIN